MNKVEHIPVLCAEAVEALAVRPGGIYVDATFGGGGHSKAILSKLKKGKLYAFDQDESTAKQASLLQRMHFVLENFRNLCAALAKRGILQVEGILADLGMSSLQLHHPGRGFSHMLSTAPLDMRMQHNSGRPTAAFLLNTAPQIELRRIFAEYGELSRAAALARSIVEAREKTPLQTVGQLKALLQRFAPPKQPARFWAKLFQALRIAVNDELEALKSLLQQSVKLIRTQGRLVIISYHSLEDRLVKRFIHHGHFDRTPLQDSRGQPLPVPFVPLHRKPIRPSEEECRENPSARSAKMRVGVKNSYTPNDYA